MGQLKLDLSQINFADDTSNDRQVGLNNFTDSVHADIGDVLTKDSNGNIKLKPLPSNIAYLDLLNIFIETNKFPQIGIGMSNSSAFDASNPERLRIESIGLESSTAIGVISDNSDYIQMNMQNTSSSASTDYVATADNGTNSSNYIDIGINGSDYADNYVGVANDGYLFVDGANLCIGTVTSGKSLIFFTNGSDSYANKKLEINYEGVATFYNVVIAEDGTEINHVATIGQLNTKQNSLGDISGIVKGDGTGGYTGASAGTDYLAPNGNGSQLTNLTKSQVGLSNVTNTDCTNASNITSGTLSNSRLNSSVTVQGNNFNGVSQLVQTNSSGYLPALNGSLLTNITASQVSAISSTLTSGNIIVGNSSNIASSVAMSGDATISNTGALTIANNVVTNAKIAQAPANTYKGNATGSTANVSDISTNTAFNQNFETNINVIKAIGNTASVGSSNNIARADHIHPNDIITETNVSITLSTQTIVHSNSITSLQIYLPLASSYTNKEYTIVNSGTGTTNIVCTGSDTIQGRTNVDIYVQNALLEVKSNGTTWDILGYYSPCASGYLFLGNTQGQPQAIQMSGDGTISAAGVLTIASNVISLSKIAQLPQNTYLGNNTGSSANVTAIGTNTAFNVNFETSVSNIKADGTASLGTTNTVARADHVHPSGSRSNQSGSYIQVSNASTQSIPANSVATKVTFSTETQDNLGEFGSNRFTSLSSQTVLVSSVIPWAAPSASNRSLVIMIYKNGSELYRQTGWNTSNGLSTSTHISFPVQLEINEYIEIYAMTSNNLAVNLTGGKKLTIKQMY